MPNQKSKKGKRNKRTNSSGDEQENGTTATGEGQGGATALLGATVGLCEEKRGEALCATPLVCSFGRPINLEKDDYQRVLCNSEVCPYATWMHLQCFYEWESSILVQFNCIGRARSWNEKQCRQNMWTKKGYDLAFRFCSCRCGQGHLKKDTDWYQVRRMQDDRKKKLVLEKTAGKPIHPSSGGGATGGEPQEDPRKWKPLGSNKLATRHEPCHQHPIDRQNSQERCHGSPPCAGSLASQSSSQAHGQSSGISFLTQNSLLGPRSSRHLGEFLKSAIQMDNHRKNVVACAVSGRGIHIDHLGQLPLSRLAPGDTPVQFLRRLDLSELLTHVPRHKMNTYHVRMEDDIHVGQGEDLRKFILSALSACHRNVVNCALCQRTLPIFEQFPLVDGTLFLSPSRHEEIEYDVPCHLQGRRLMHLYALCVDCLEGVHKIVCIKCKSRWDGSWHQLGTLYTYDILAASPCCQARLNCKHCGKPVIDVRVGMQFFSEYSNVQQCPHCGNLDYHFVKPFSSFKVLEAY
ncbi:hypothetical protein ACEWY4_021653 [Coilia grayii]|uniref:Headcase middle domain-containing protein n=1 Tax=Coilia grayii TaxID=363190 RepID=A0ABD1J5L6_9TELE